MSIYLIGVVFMVGLLGVLSCHNIMKKIIALNIMNGAIVMFFVYHGSRMGETAPIHQTETPVPVEQSMVDPLSQALMLTAIVVGICIVALGLSIAVLLYRRFNSLDIRRIEENAWGRGD